MIVVAREAQDRAIIDEIDAQSEGTLDEFETYAKASGPPRETRHGVILRHSFNHQTHHRAKVHDMPGLTPVAPPPLDMIDFMREMPEAA